MYEINGSRESVLIDLKITWFKWNLASTFILVFPFDQISSSIDAISKIKIYFCTEIFLTQSRGDQQGQELMMKRCKKDRKYIFFILGHICYLFYLLIPQDFIDLIFNGTFNREK